nr:rhamnan synthesis F family protein [Gluconacetobacter johannae]
MAPHVRHYLAELAACGMTIHLALSGAAKTDAQTAQFCARHGITAHPRPNGGLDFGAWQDLLAAGCAAGADRIVLANDSVFGPLRPLAPIVRAMMDRPADVWGLVESHSVAWHLQSWFLCFTAQALDHPAIRLVLAQPFARMNKPEIVLHGEVGLGLAIRSAGLRAAAAWPDRRAGLRRLVPTNPMHADWLSVARSDTVPFIKVELLRDNPCGIFWTGQWRALVARSPQFQADWIETFLRDQPRRGATPRAGWKMRLLYLVLSRDRGVVLTALLSGRGGRG